MSSDPRRLTEEDEERPSKKTAPPSFETKTVTEIGEVKQQISDLKERIEELKQKEKDCKYY
jgi:hypothetical protein